MENEDKKEELTTDKLKSVIESILFLNGEPITILKLAKLTGAKKPLIENALLEMEGDFKNENRGVAIIQKEESVQMVTKPANSSYLNQLVKSEIHSNLSNAAMEVLSIVAYRGPISRAEIEDIRGVNCTFTLRNLLIRGLIERMENEQGLRSYLYKISFDFLKHLGLEKIEQLPNWEMLSPKSR